MIRLRIDKRSEPKGISDVLASILQIAVSLTTILGIIGLVFGIFYSYRYLSKIGYVSIFPDILLQSSALIAVLMSFFIWILFYIYVSLIVYIPFTFSEDFKRKNINGFFVFDFFILLYIFVVLFLLHLSGANWFTYIFILVNLFVNIVYACGYNYSFIYKFLYKIFRNKSRDINNIKDVYSFFIKYFLINTSVFLFIFLVGTGCLYQSFLYGPRLIEKPQDASWYLIHSNNAQETINGLSLADISKIKHNFKMNSDENSDENSKVYSHNLDKNSQALYGYMAWNVGKTKIFCPDSFDNFNVKDNSKSKCLVIDADNLQLMPDAYFK